MNKSLKIFLKNKWIKRLFIVLIALLVCELILRYIVGLGELPIYITSEEYEYFYAPNQDVNRFGNKVVTNEYGMRSGKVQKKKRIILEFGDSILNGGSHVDQDDLATTIQENVLNGEYNNKFQVLNVSAQSWGPSNAFAFLKKHGDFNAELIVLVFSSHDLNDNMHFREVVGTHPAWPSSQPMLALTDLFSRYVFPKIGSIFSNEGEYNYLKGFDDSKINPGWESFFNYCKEKQIPLVVYLHASKSEISAGSYNQRGIKIKNMCKENNAILIMDLKEMSKADDPFIDEMHLNAEGHEIMSKLLLKTLIPHFNHIK